MKFLEKELEISAETSHNITIFQKKFRRRGKAKNHQVRINLKSDARKRRRVSIQINKAMIDEIGRLLKEGQIGYQINEIKVTYPGSQQ